MNCSRTLKVVGATTLALLVGIRLAAAQDYPNKPIHLIVPYATGGITDVQSRVLARKLQPLLGQPVVVENKPGASAQIGSQAVAMTAPDGYTLLVSGSSSHVMAAALKKLPYDTIKDFKTVAMVAQVPLVLAVPVDLPANDLRAFISLLKSPKGPWNYGHAGTGTGAHVTGARLLKTIGVEAEGIGYSGTAGAITDLAGGRLTFLIDSPGALIPQLQAGRIKALAVFAKERLATLPEVPTVGEAGLPEAMKDDWELWQGISAPAKTPDAIVAKLNAAINVALKDDELKEQFTKLGLIPILGDAAYAQRRLENDFATIVPLLKSMGVQQE